MEFVTGLEDRKVKTLEELEREESVGTEVTVEGMVHSIRDMGEISFVILRSRDGLLQRLASRKTPRRHSPCTRSCWSRRTRSCRKIPSCGKRSLWRLTRAWP